MLTGTPPISSHTYQHDPDNYRSNQGDSTTDDDLS